MAAAETCCQGGAADELDEICEGAVALPLTTAPRCRVERSTVSPYAIASPKDSQRSLRCNSEEGFLIEVPNLFPQVTRRSWRSPQAIPGETAPPPPL